MKAYVLAVAVASSLALMVSAGCGGTTVSGGGGTSGTGTKGAGGSSGTGTKGAGGTKGTGGTRGTKGSGGTAGSSGCPFPDFTRDYPVPADAGAPLADGGLNCATICPDPGPVMAGPGIPVSCAIVAADGGNALECVYRPSCL
jgi:hypothetical protein